MAEKGQQQEQGKQEKQPAGGHDKTPVPSRGNRKDGYTVRFTFHGASNLPMSDINKLSSDPYILAVMKTSLPKRHKQDDDLFFRTPTAHRTTEPKWEASWIVANLPSDGFRLKLHVLDEDPGNKDDMLGHVNINFDSLDERFTSVDKGVYKIEKRKGSWRAYAVRSCAVGLARKKMHGEVQVSIEILGKTESKHSEKVYTIGPNYWRQHFSPIIGRLANTKGDDENDGVEKYDFEANQIQLTGPVPDELYHRFVEFKGFVKGMFTSTGLRGRPLNFLLHKQHANIYAYDRNTKTGVIETPSKELTQQFLRMAHHDEGYRLFTYVILLDGLMRFTETGKEFGIDLLSKHTMHSDVSQYIACSGEFMVRKAKRRSRETAGDDHLEKEAEDNGSAKPDSDLDAAQPPDSKGRANGRTSPKPSEDPADFELIIDNDSGTYRPDKDVLPRLKSILEANFVGLKITVLACDDDKLQEIKSKQRDHKKKQADRRIYRQTSFASSSSGSISSSDAESLNEAADREADQDEKERRKKNGSNRLKNAANAVSSPKSAAIGAVDKGLP